MCRTGHAGNAWFQAARLNTAHPATKFRSGRIVTGAYPETTLDLAVVKIGKGLTLVPG